MEAQFVSCELDQDDSIVPPDIMIKAYDVDGKAELWREAGLTNLVDHADELSNAAKAGAKYEAMTEADYRLFADWLDIHETIAACDIILDDRESFALIKAQKSGYFNDFIVLRREEKNERIIIGMVKTSKNTRYFSVSKWLLPTTTAEWLRQREQQRPQQEKPQATEHVSLTKTDETEPEPGSGQATVQELLHNPQPVDQGSESGRALGLGAMTLAFGGLAWIVFAIFGSWWLFAGVLFALMCVCWGATGEFTPRQEAAHYVVGWISGLLLVLGLPVFGWYHLYDLNTTETVQKVLVCGTGHNYDDGHEYIDTDHGFMTLLPGTYMGNYDFKPDKNTARTLLGEAGGNVVEVTTHGYKSTNEKTMLPYVTKATIVGPGNCARTYSDAKLGY